MTGAQDIKFYRNLLGNQIAIALVPFSSHPASKLMQSRQSKTIRIHNGNDRGVRDIDADLDDRCRNQNVILMSRKGINDIQNVRLLHIAADGRNPHFRVVFCVILLRLRLRHGDRSNILKFLVIGLLNERSHDIRLMPDRKLSVDTLKNFLIASHLLGNSYLPAGRHFRNRNDVYGVPIHRHGIGPRNGRRSHIDMMGAQSVKPSNGLFLLYATLDEIRVFLSKFSGLGPPRVKKLVDAYGLDVLETIRSTPDALLGLGLPPDVCKKIRDELVEDNCFEEILTFLQLNELDFRFALPIFMKYKTMAFRKIKDNPYALFHDKIIDFKTADRLAYKLDFSPESRERTEAAVLACMEGDSESKGNLFIPYSMLPQKLEKFLQCQESGFDINTFSPDSISNAVEGLTRSNLIVVDQVPASGDICLYLRQNYWAETKIVEKMKYLEQSPKRFSFKKADIEAALTEYEVQSNIQLAPEQKEAVISALCSHLSIITGGPGTGKSTTLNAMLFCIRKLAPGAALSLCAPTGKAALRMTEVTNTAAATIHRTLKMGRFSQQLKSEELVCDFLVVDEFSMVDCFLCATLLDAVISFARVIIVGDHEQLPSVGPGLVLRDMIRSGKVPTTRLTEIFRQGKTSPIIRNSHEIIRDREEDDRRYTLLINQKPGGAFYFLEKDAVSKIQKAICKSVHQLMDKYSLAPDEIKVLTTIHSGNLGTGALNHILQDEFNPSGEAYERGDGLEIRIGDPVIHLKNNYDLGVFNGETGTVKAFGYDPDKTLLVAFPGGRDVWYSERDADELDLAYATTVHKAQGNEAKAVIIPVHDILLHGLSKNLLYTAITRAKQMVVLVGSKDAFSTALRRSTMVERRSNLITRLTA